MTLPETADLALDARWVIPVEPPNSVLEHHSVLIRDGVIRAVIPTEEAERRFAPRQRLSLDSHVLLPGLVNLHTHAAMTLLRGFADDLPLEQWLNARIWPAEQRHVSRRFVYDGSLLACAEMLRGGITCFNDMYFFPEAAADAALRAGMRAALGIIVIEFPTAYAADPQAYLDKGLTLRDQLKEESLISFCLAPHAPYTVSDRSFSQVLTYAELLDLPIHVHLHETRGEIESSLRDHGVRPLQRLRSLGLLGPRLLAVHGIHLTQEECALLGHHGSHVAHCPTSNLKLAGGFAPVPALLENGVNVGLGTDGAASNNRLDLFSEMRTAALLAKAGSGDAGTLPAHDVLRCATLSGARALGLDGKIGALVPGKRADLIAVNLQRLELSPCYDPVSHLVYAAGREDVSHVWIDGKPVVQDGRLLTLDTEALLATTREWQQVIASP